MKITWVFCAWCGRFMWRFKFTKYSGVSHTICRKCNKSIG